MGDRRAETGKKFDDAEQLDDATRAFLGAFADALTNMRDRVRAETREAARPKVDRAEVAVTNEALYRVGLKQFLARPEEAKRGPRNPQPANVVVGGDATLRASLKAGLSQAQSAFELRRVRGRERRQS